MMKDRVENLKQAASEADRRVLDAIYSAYENSFSRYEAESSKANLTEWQAAEKALKEKVAELSGVFFVTKNGAAFRNLTAVFEFLKDQGYKIGQRKVYNDADAGHIKVNPDRSVNESEARAYAERFLKKIKSGGSDSGDLDKLYREKAEAELKGLQFKNEKLQFELEQSRKEWIRREDAETQIAIKLGAVDAQMKGIIRDRALDWLYAIGGDPKKQDVLIDLMNADMDGMFNRLAELEEFELVVRMPDVDRVELEEE